MTVNTNVGPQYQLNFAYDYKGRRIQKVVAIGGIGIYTNDFLYDGWNLIATFNPQSSALASYVWGSDLSGSMQGAGGIGGLLEVINYGSSTNFVAFDGNGNVAALVNGANGTLAANYEYGPFGEPIRMTGLQATANPFRFSTKYDDDESDLLYYGYRYYKPSTGTWPNRDPIHEQGGVNLYNIVNNNPVSNVDNDGRVRLQGEELQVPSKWGKCGTFLQIWRQYVDNSSDAPGYIVQEINFSWQWSDSLGGRHYVHDHFWESGYLITQQNIGLGYYDTWMNSKTFPNSDGIGIIKGIARFYAESTTGILHWGAIPGPSPWSGNQSPFATKTEPDFWKFPSEDGEAEATHQTVVFWQCVCGFHSTTVLSSPQIPSGPWTLRERVNLIRQAR